MWVWKSYILNPLRNLGWDDDGEEDTGYPQEVFWKGDTE